MWDLTLYQVSDGSPELVVQQAQPEHVVGQPLGGLELLGYDLEKDEVSRPSARPVTCPPAGRM